MHIYIMRKCIIIRHYNYLLSMQSYNYRFQAIYFLRFNTNDRGLDYFKPKVSYIMFVILLHLGSQKYVFVVCTRELIKFMCRGYPCKLGN